MHRPQLITWTTHTAETTTLLEATRLQKLYTYMCNIVTEFYLYSIVYIYLINSRLDVTHSVRHHFRTIQTLSSRTNSSLPYGTQRGPNCNPFGNVTTVTMQTSFTVSVISFIGNVSCHIETLL